MEINFKIEYFSDVDKITDSLLQNTAMGIFAVVLLMGLVVFASWTRSYVEQDRKNGNRANWYKIAITAAFILAAILILGVFHSGALGTTTNPL
jgi:Mn2+/Fe2+ NRAMP family transporter